MDISKIYCNNCGIRGHLYKDCPKPIISCGQIIFRNDSGEPKILMVQRKDSLCYIEFIRGKYDIYNIDYIIVLLNKCNFEERKKILDKEYDILWKDLWLVDDKDLENQKNNVDFKRGLDKFNKIKNGFFCKKKNKYVSLRILMESVTTDYKETEWEFPKGRRNNNESNIQCSIREFREETNYVLDDYNIIKNITPLNEEFRGENKVNYKYIYYISYLLNTGKSVFIDYNNRDQYTELKDIRWVTKREALSMIRDYHYTRKNVINKIFEMINKIGEDYNLY